MSNDETREALKAARVVVQAVLDDPLTQTADNAVRSAQVILALRPFLASVPVPTDTKELIERLKRAQESEWNANNMGVADLLADAITALSSSGGAS